MADTWDDSDDDWDKDEDDDELDRKLGLKQGGNKNDDIPNFDDEKDLAITEKELQDKARNADLKKRGNALAAKKREEQERLEEMELARKTMELEAEAESKLSLEERRQLQQQRIEDADHALTDDLFGGVDNRVGRGSAAGKATAAGDRVSLKDMKDHLMHARKVAESMKAHGKIHLATAFFKEAFQQSKDIMDEDGIAELIKTLNVIKNEKMTAAKRKVKGQAQKSKKADKAAAAKARQIQVETFGDNDQYDQYDTIGEDYEDAFF